MYRVLLTLLFLSLFSCMKVSELGQNQAFLEPKGLNQSVNQSVKSPLFKLGDWPNQNWWSVFESKTLNVLIEQAFLENQTLLAVDQKINIAKERAVQTKAPLFPYVFFQANEDWGRLSKNGIPYAFQPSLGTLYDLVELKFNFSYEIDFWGKNRNLLQAALGELRAQKAEKEQVKLMISTSLAKAYFALKTDKVRLKLLKALLNNKKEQAQLIDSLNQSGILSKFDPATLQEEVQRYDQEIESLIFQIDQNAYEINLLRGKSADVALNIPCALEPLPCALQLPKNLSSDLVIRKPDLAASLWHIEALMREVNASVADYFPRVDLMGFLGMQSFPFKHLFDWSSREGQLNPSIHIPIFNASNIRANHRKKQAELQEAIYTYNNLLLSSLKEAALGINRVFETYQQKQNQQVILDQSRLKLRLTKRLYESGIESQIADLKAQEKYLQAKLEDLWITYKQYLAVIELIKSLGGGYLESDLNWFDKKDVDAQS